MKRLIMLSIVVITLITNAQDKKGINTTVFKTDITCENCEAKIMKYLPYEKGVKNVDVVVKDKLVLVSYKQAKNTDKQLGEAIEKLGYQAELVGHPAFLNVKGNCDMCKERIEKAAMDVKGVSLAFWDVDSQQLSVVYDAKQTDLFKIESVIANTGHDTNNALANDEIYNALPDCCKYR